MPSWAQGRGTSWCCWCVRPCSPISCHFHDFIDEKPESWLLKKKKIHKCCWVVVVSQHQNTIKRLLVKCLLSASLSPSSQSPKKVKIPSKTSPDIWKNANPPNARTNVAQEVEWLSINGMVRVLSQAPAVYMYKFDKILNPSLFLVGSSFCVWVCMNVYHSWCAAGTLYESLCRRCMNVCELANAHLCCKALWVVGKSRVHLLESSQNNLTSKYQSCVQSCVLCSLCFSPPLWWKVTAMAQQQIRWVSKTNYFALHIQWVTMKSRY